jgi:Mg2+-importing ATPase
MLTGDSASVACAVAKRFDLAHGINDVVTGAQWLSYTEADRAHIVRMSHVYAAVTPSQKYEILKTLQSLGERVGFLGDGINDAPALSQAQVGIAVSEATDIARESADVILLERDLGVLVRGIEDGRKLFVNVIKYIKATLISNMGNFLALLSASFLISFLPMRSSQLLLVNLLTDLPMIAIAFDGVDKSEVRRPQKYDVGSIIKVSIVLGLISTIFDLLFFAMFAPHGEAYLQTHWFIESNLTELVLIFSVRTKLPFWRGGKPSIALVAATLFGIVGTLIVPFTSFGRDLFGFQHPSMPVVWLIMGGIACYFAVTEVAKYLFYRRERKRFVELPTVA